MIYLITFIADLICSAIVTAIIALVAQGLKIDFGEPWNSILLLIVLFMLIGKSLEFLQQYYEHNKSTRATGGEKQNAL